MSQILAKFRELMKAKKLDWYILPRTDEHQSEYICQCDKRVQFMSGFTGTNAFTLISLKQALLWTDGRYFLQAQKQLKQGWSLKKLIATQKKWFEYLLEVYNPNQNKIGIDSRLISASIASERFKALKQKGFQICTQNYNLVDQIWQNRPKSTACQIFIHQEWAGKSILEKVQWIRKAIEQKNGNAALFGGYRKQLGFLTCGLDKYHLIPISNLFQSSLDMVALYICQTITNHLNKVDIKIQDYPPKFQEKTLVQSSTLNYSLYQNLKDPIEWSQGISLFRAIRDQKEIEGFRNSHVRDGVAMAKFWAWRSAQKQISQWDAALYMNKMRTQNQNYKGPSFQTTSAGGPNAAVIHYKPKQTPSFVIQESMIHLVDSGGQYLDGTTDVTRTFHFGNPTDEERDAYTRVLLGNLDIQRMVWPKSVDLDGKDFDLLARRHLFQVGKDYQHGTGHGVGYYLGVHEGPVGISKVNKTVFKAGMIVSNQPGYYQEGQFGIRIQNLIIVQQKDNCYFFQNLTLCPYDINLIKIELLSSRDKKFINSYHEKVFSILCPLLEGKQQVQEWLKFATRKIQ